MERDYGPLTIEQAALNLAGHLRFLLLVVNETPRFGEPGRDDAIRMTHSAEQDLARSLADFGEAISRARPVPSGDHTNSNNEEG